MAKERTGGMTAIGIMNIIFGALGSLLCLLVAIGGGFLAAAGGSMESAMQAELGADAEGLGEMAATGGAIMLVIGLLGAAAWAVLFVGGIGVLKVASWGRKLCIGSAGVLGLLTIVNFTQGGANFMSFALLAYCGTVVGLCFSSTWKNAFNGEEEWNVSAASDDQFRAAA